MKRLITIFAAGLLIAACDSAPKGEFTRGIGVYPGNPEESAAPQLVENTEYGNVAAFKAAYHSSSYDYNLTAQLVTDGMISTKPSASYTVLSSNGPVAKRERGWMFDDKANSGNTFTGSNIFIQLDMEEMAMPADYVNVIGTVTLDTTLPKGYEIVFLGSRDGKSWTEFDRQSGRDLIGQVAAVRPRAATPVYNNPSPVTFLYNYEPKPQETPSMAAMFNMGAVQQNTVSRALNLTAQLPKDVAFSHFKIEFNIPAARRYAINDWDFYKDGELQQVLPFDYFNSAWRSEGSGEEWVYVDFGSKAKFDKVVLHWINKAVKGSVQISDDAKTWKDVASLPGGSGKIDEIAAKGSARYLRILAQASENGAPYELSELQVFGKGGLVPVAKEAPAPTSTRQDLTGGKWKLQRINLVSEGGAAVSKVGYNDNDWIVATVPGTVLGSFINNGSVGDPNYSDNQLMVSDSYFVSDFWYRDEFTVNNPAERTFLNFDGINWKAEVYLNGKYVDLIEGAFIRGKFDVTDYVEQGQNAIAVKIIRNAHPGAIKEQNEISADNNGGAPGADNPTFHATIGWDWIPTIRGRSIGIWNDVYLTFGGSVTVEDPFIRAELPLPDTTSANLFVEVTLKNHKDQPVTGVLQGTYGDTAFETAVSLAANEEKLVKLDSKTNPELHLVHPKLWWPKGYGEQNLYDVKIAFNVNGKVSDTKEFKSGVRQMDISEVPYQPSGGMPRFTAGPPVRLEMKVNGRRFIGFGGNWGFPETNVNYRAREYDIAVAYHADMNFTMIRNWVGQTGDEEFYDACDKYGIMVWQDFWLANPVDGENPYYPDMFEKNARDYVRRIRNHPSIGIYVGRNEGNPPERIDNYLRKMTQEEHPGLYYIPHSSSGSVSGGGPYRAMAPKEYFRSYGHDKMHSERGMPTVMTYEDMVRAFGEEHMEPVNTRQHPNNIYGMHDYTLESAQGGDSFNQIIATAFGEPKDAKEFAELAQFVNYNGYRAIFEGRSEHRRGMILWMSHPSWPSMVWQTYDYYFEPTGSYFGCKKACEPIHIQWNPIRDDVEVVNYHTKDWKGLVAKAQVVDQNGKVQWEHEVTFDIHDDETVACFPLEFPDSLTDTYFIKLVLCSGNQVLSDNFYFKGKVENNFQSLRNMPKVSLTKDVKIERDGDNWTIKGTVKNDSETPALLIRLKLEGTTDLILPVFYSDNYFSLLPGESKDICITFKNEDTRGEKPSLSVSGFNVI